MKSRILAMGLLSAILASTSSGVVSAKQTKIIELATKDPGSKKVTIRVSGQSLLLAAGEGTESMLFTDEAMFTMNNKDKTYRVQSYEDLQALASQKAAELAQSRAAAGRAQGVELKLTEETETISGFRTRKLIRTNKGEPATEFWVSSELVPRSLRELGERLTSILPKHHWASLQGNPGIAEIMMLFGVPLRITYAQHTFNSRVIESSESSLQVPAGYRKLDK